MDLLDSDDSGSISIDEFMSAILDPTPEDEVLYGRDELVALLKRDRASYQAQDAGGGAGSTQLGSRQNLSQGNRSDKGPSAGSSHRSGSTKGSVKGSVKGAVVANVTKTSDVPTPDTGDRLTLPSYHILSSFSSLGESVVANGESLIVHSCLARSPSVNFTRYSKSDNEVSICMYL